MINIIAQKFQSTLPYGSDGVFMFLFSAQHRFQSTLPYGSDKVKELEEQIPEISIHAPLRERPYVKVSAAYDPCHFNPRSLTGATLRLLLFIAACRFQSTLPYGSDFPSASDKQYISQFQSTLPYGSDGADHDQYHCAEISIHAPLRERLQEDWSGHPDRNFNPRSLTGATHRCYHLL